MIKNLLIFTVLVAGILTDKFTCGKYVCDLGRIFKDYPKGKISSLQQSIEVANLLQYVQNSEHNCGELTRQQIFEDVNTQCANRGAECLNVISDLFKIGETIRDKERTFIGKVFDYLSFSGQVFKKLGQLTLNCKDSKIEIIQG